MRGFPVTEADILGYKARGFTVRETRTRRAALTLQQGKRFSSGKRADLDNRYFRSAWEANVARYLNYLQSRGVILRWEYEPDEFEFPVKRGPGKFYKPDFKIWYPDGTFLYWEVKGYMDQASATKLKRMRKHYPQYRVELIDKYRYYKEISPLRGLLPGWETEQ